MKHALKKTAMFLMITALVSLALNSSCMVIKANATSNVWTGDISTTFGIKSGSGNSSDAAIIIDTGAQLAHLAYLVDNGNSETGMYFKLSNDIDLNSIAWTPIGTSQYPFEGHFLGNNYKISNLLISGNNDYQGLFGYIGSGGSVENLFLANESVTGVSYIGGVAGFVADGASLICCGVGDDRGTLTGSNYVGGIAGGVAGTVSGCGNNNIVRNNTGIDFGGIAGWASGTIESCSNLASVNDTGGSSEDGGIVGQLASGGTVKFCYNTYIVTGQDNVGGIVGLSDTGTMVNSCYSTGTLQCGSESTGGIVGGTDTGASVSISNCIAISRNQSNGARILGGASGQNITLSQNYAWSDMTIGGSAVTGGLADNANGADASSSDIIYNSNSIWTDFIGVNTSIWSYNVGQMPSLTGLVGAQYHILPGYILWNANAPVITVQPSAQTTVVQNGAVNLSVAATGVLLTYQWYSNTENNNTTGTPISGAEGASYSPPTSSIGTIYYYCVITNTDSSATGSTTATAASNIAEVTVEAKKLSSISVTTPPTKTTYIENTAFDTNGMVVTATYNNGETADVSGYTVTPNVLTLGTNAVTISYTENGITETETLFGLTVVPKKLSSIAVTAPPTKTTYIENTAFDKNGMVVTATYNDGETADVSGYTVTPNVLTTLGTNTITISYMESGITKTETFSGITVVPKKLSSIAVTAPPTKTTYIENTAFDTNGMVVTATYDNGEKADVSGYTVTPNVFTLGENAVTISYTENGITKTKNMPGITVVPKRLSSISVTTPPTKTTYIENTAFDTTGMVVTATYDNGEKADVSGYTVAPNVLTLGTNTITISYTESGITKTETLSGMTVVHKKLFSISVTAPPTKTTYIENTTFDTNGMAVTATYDNGEEADVSGYTFTPNVLILGTNAVTLSYTEDGIIKTTKVQVTVSPQSQPIDNTAAAPQSRSNSNAISAAKKSENPSTGDNELQMLNLIEVIFSLMLLIFLAYQRQNNKA